MKPNKLIQNQYFSEENNNLAQYVICNALPGISFINCTFESLDFSGEVFGSCSFQNCIFNDINARKCLFSGCCLKDCKIINSDMTRTEFDNTRFINCELLGVDLQASDFDECELKETTFKNSRLGLIGVFSVKFSNSKQSIQIEDSLPFKKQDLYIFEKSLKDLNLIISTDSNEIDDF